MSGSVLKILSQLQSVPFNGSVNSDSLRPYCVQHIRLHCPSPTPRACLKFKPIKMVMPSNHFFLCCLLLLPSVFLSIRVLIPSPICPVLSYQSNQPGSELLLTCLPSLQGPASSCRLGYRLAHCCILGSCHIVKFWWGVNAISYSFISYVLSACVG